MKRKILLFTTALLLFSTFSVDAVSYRSYGYVSSSGEVYDVEAPVAYVPGEIYNSKSLNIDLQSPEDLYIDKDGKFYVADKGGNAVYSFDNLGNVTLKISSFNNGSEEDSLSEPEGVNVAPDGSVWIADTGNNRLLHFSKEGRFIKEIGKPESPILDDTFEFIPTKFVVDDVGRIFIVCRNVYDGLVQLSTDGDFEGFVGSNYAVSNWYEQFWQSIMTEEQNSKRNKFIGMEYANICLDSTGFLYVATAVSDVANPIRRLNPSGEDVLIRNAINGVKKVSGDLYFPKDLPPSIIDVAVNSDNIYYALDATRGRVFAYDDEGNMLFEFGGIGTYQKGTFKQPCSLAVYNNCVYVLDRDNASVTQYSPTDYALNIYKASKLYSENYFEESLDAWEKLVQQNCNFDLAYDKAGFSLYRMGEYEKAMKYFSMANDRDSYSKALSKYRREWMNKHFAICTISAVSAILIICVGIYLIRKKLKFVNQRRVIPDERS